MTIEKAPSADEAFRLFTEVLTDPGLAAINNPFHPFHQACLQVLQRL